MAYSSRLSSRRSNPRRESPPPRTCTPAPTSARRIACCGMLISIRAAFIAALAFILLLTIAWSCLGGDVATDVVSDAAAVYTFRVEKEYPHDPEAFTQGLLYVEKDTLYESTGLYHKSSIRRVNLQSGKVMDVHKMDGSHFGEGLTLLGSRLFQVTWLTRTGFIYDLHNLSKLGSFSHEMSDGWGLATDGHVIFGSDGSSSLYQMDPKNFKVSKRVAVKYGGSKVQNLNELEYIKGEIWANVWMTNCIARISPEDGKVIGWILGHQLRESLWEAGHNDIDVLNGIAWDDVNDRIFVTGKLWPKLYQVKLVNVSGMPMERVKYLCNL